MGARQTYKEEFNELFARTQDLVDGGDERKETIFNRQYTTPYFICILSMNKLEKLLGPYFLIMMKNISVLSEYSNLISNYLDSLALYADLKRMQKERAGSPSGRRASISRSRTDGNSRKYFAQSNPSVELTQL
jgi:hypothetical protein